MIFIARRTICSFLIFALLTLNLQPVVAFDIGAAGDRDSLSGRQAASVSDLGMTQDALPPFPEDESPEAFDWSTIDWDKIVTLPSDEEEYVQKVQEFITQQRLDEVKALKKKEHPFSSDYVMEHYGVPQVVQDLVRQYRETLKDIADDQKNSLKEKLVYDIKQALKKENLLPTSTDQEKEADSQFDHVLKASSSISSPVTNGTPAGSIGSEDIKADVIDSRGIPDEGQSLDGATIEELEKKDLPASVSGQSSYIPSLGKNITVTIQKLFSFLFGIQKANAASPLISWYEGIEDTTPDFALYYLSQVQKNDGSFGSENIYEVSSDVALLLSEMNRTNNDQYDQLITYLKNTPPRTTREKIIKLRLLVALKEPYEDLLKEVYSLQNTNGGFSLQKGYMSDAGTTMEFILAMWGINTAESTKKLIPALNYIINTIGTDSSLSLIPDGPPNYYLIAKTVEYLRPIWDLQFRDADSKVVVVSVQEKIDALLAFLDKSINKDTGTLSGSTDASDYAMTLRVLQLYNVYPQAQGALAETLARFQYADGSFGHSLYATIPAARAFRKGDLAITEIQKEGDYIGNTSFTILAKIKNKGLAATSITQLFTFFDGVLIGEQGMKKISFEPSKDNPNVLIPKENGRIGKRQGIPVPFTTIAPGEEKIIRIKFSQDIGARMTGKTSFLLYVDSVEDENEENNWNETSLEFKPDSNGVPALPLYAVIYKYDLGGIPALNVRWQKRNDANRKNYDVLFRKPGESQWRRIVVPFQQGWNGAFFGFPFGLDGQNVEGKTYEFTLAVLHANADLMTYIADPITITLSADPKKYVGSVEASVTRDAQSLGSANVWGYGLSGMSDKNGTLELKNVQHGINEAWVDVPYYEKLATSFEIKPGERTKDARRFTRVKADSEPPVLDRTEISWPLKNSMVKNQKSWTVLATGVDNIFFDHVDFWYFDPSQQAWVFLRSEKALSNQAFFDWDIPKELIGKGYKLKAIAYDYVGNASAPKEWGPFEILDGSAATAAVNVEGLVQNAWSLGEKKTVKWEIKSANPLLEITSVRLKLDTSTVFIKGNSPADLKSADYTIPKNASYESDAATILVSYCDKAFTCGTAQSEPFRIVDPSPPPPAPWGKERRSNMVASKYPIDRYMDSVFQNSDGSKEIIYREFDKSDPNGSEMRRIVYRKVKEGVWQDPVVLVEHQYKWNETDDIIFNEVRTVKADDGSIHIVFQRYVGGPSANADGTEIFYLHLKDGLLQKREQISSDTTVSQAARLALNASGDVFITWVEGFSYATWKGTPTVKYREFVGGRWSDVARLTNENSSNPIVIEDNGSVLVVYSEDEQFFMQVKRDGQWWVPSPIVPRTISKKELDSVNKISDVRDAIVEQDPNDPTLYRWLPSIKKKSDLDAILKNKQFEAKDTVLYLWFINQYGRGAYAPQLFAKGNNEYDLFFKKGGEKRNWRYDISLLSFSLTDYKKGDARVTSYRSMMEAPSLDDGRGFSVARNKDGQYHIAYSRMWWPPAGQSQSSIYYVFFDGTNLLHRTQIASPFRYVDDQRPLILERDDVVSVYFGDFTSDLSMVNTADLSKLKQYRLTPLKPVIGGTTKGFPVDLEWDVQGGNLSSYSVLVGKTLDDLKEQASELKEQKFTLEGLDADTEYYWQVIGKEGAQSVYGGSWRFTTGPPQPKIKVSVGDREYKDKNTIGIGKVDAGKTQDIALTFLNTGNGDLKISDLILNGSSAFTIKEDFKEAVKAGELRKLTLQFSASDNNDDQKTELSFSTNDPNAAKFTFTLAATIVRPKIVVLRTNDGNVWTNGSKPSFGVIPLGEGRGLNLTIRNIGTGNLTFTGDTPLKISDDVDGSYVLYLNDDKKLLTPGEESLFRVYLKPKSVGKKTATLTILSDAQDANKFILKLEGEGASPVMDVSLDEKEIKTDDTISFGEMQQGDKKEISVEIKNSGNYDLILPTKIEGATNFSFKGKKVISNGPNGSEYETIVVSPSTSLQEVLTFIAPEDLGEKSAKISWLSNDPEKKIFTVTVKAIVVKPVLRVNAKGFGSPVIWTERKSGDGWGIGLLAPGQIQDATISLENIGNTKLILSDVKLEGEGYSGGQFGNPFDLFPGDTAYPVIQFIAPKKAGVYKAEYSFKTNDRKAPLFSLVFEGLVWGLDMVLKQGNSEIKNGASVDFGSVPSGEAKEIKVTISNNGSNANLKVSDVTLDGSDTFTIVSKPSDVIEPGKSADLVVRFASPQKFGEYSETLSFKSNDPDKEQTTLALKATATRAELALTSDGKIVKTNDEFILGDFAPGKIKDITFTIANTGNSVLSLTDLKLVGSDFTIVTRAAETVAPGKSTSLTVRFISPKTKGEKQATLSFTTSDPNKKDIVLTFEATTRRSEFSFLSDGKAIQNNDVINLGDLASGKIKDAIFTIINTGNADLELSDIALAGSDAFVITAQPVAPLQPGAITNLEVRFTSPKLKGDTSAKLFFATNDPDRQGMELNIRATARRPQLVLKNGENVVSRNTFSLGSVPTGSTNDLTLSITNSGNTDLTLDQQPMPAVFNGFSLLAQPLEPLKPGTTADITVRFTSPKEIGVRSQTYEWNTNDPDMPSLSLTFKATAQRSDLKVFQNGKALSSNATIDFGSVSFGKNKEATITLANFGNSNLIVSDLVLNGEDFTFSAQSFATIIPTASTILTVRFKPSLSKGNKSAILSWKTNDPDQKDFTINFTATTLRSELTFTSDGKALVNTDIINFGELTSGKIKDMDVTIGNSGNENLILSDFKLDGANFSIVTQPIEVVAPDKSTSLTLRFTSPKQKGTKTATLSFLTNDPDKKDIAFTLTAMSKRAELVLTSDGKAVKTNAGFILGDFAPGKTKDISLVIANTGNTDLIISDLKLESSDFAFVGPIPETVVPSKSATLTVRFSALKEKGEKSTTLSFITNDPEEKEIIVVIKATVRRSELVLAHDTIALNTKDELSFGSVASGKTKDLSITITNNGNTDLIFSNFILSGSKNFATSTEITSTLQPGKSTLLGMRFAASKTKGDIAATLSFTTNDPDKKDVQLTFTATTLRPEIELTYDGTPVKRNDVIDLGILATGAKKDMALTITNKGNTDLSFDSLLLDGNTDFIIPQQQIESLAPLASITIPIKLIGQVEGEKKAKVTFITNDPDAPFVLNVKTRVAVTTGIGKGLTGEYFATKDFKALSVRRTDPQVNFDWKRLSPDSTMPLNNFSVRWSGKVESQYTGVYTFSTNTDDGARLRVNGQQIIDDWQDHTLQENKGTIALEAGKQYDISFEYYDSKDDASAQLLWETPYGRKELIPTVQLYPTQLSDLIPSPRGNGTGLSGEYYADKKLTSRVLTRTDARINFNWKSASPDPQVPVDRFSARWSGFVEPQYTGQYTFSTNTDDGSRLWVNGVKIVDQWNDHTVQENKGVITLEAGKKYSVVFEYYDSVGDAVAQLLWETPYGRKELIPTAQLYPQNTQQDKEGTGLKGEYYANANYTEHVLTRIDPEVNFAWGNGSPDPKLAPDYFATRWRGKIRIPEGGEYRFTTLADDGIRLWVDGKLLINDWMYAHPPQWFSGGLPLEAGRSYDIQLDYYEAYSGAQVQLFWNGPRTNGKEELIPQAVLTPAL